MDLLPSLRRKSTSILSKGSNQSVTKSSSLTYNSSLLKRKSTNQSISKPSKMEKKTARVIKKPKGPEFDAKPSIKKKMASPRPAKEDILFRRLSYLSVRNDEDSYFICRALQNIYKGTVTFRAQWWNYQPDTDDYRISYLADLSPDTVLTSVRVTRVGIIFLRLWDVDRAETERLLKKSINKSQGLAVSDEESETEDEPPKKKKKGETTPKKTNVTKGGKKERKARTKKDPGEKAPRKRKAAKKPAEDLELHPNPKIKILDKDPFLFSKDKVPFVSKFVQGKLAIRAVMQNDLKLLKKLAQDKEKFFDYRNPHSLSVPKSAVHYAVESQNTKALDLMQKFAEEKRFDSEWQPNVVMADRLSTGSYNPRSLNVAFIRQIMASRGTREGTNALTKDLNAIMGSTNVPPIEEIETAVKAGADWEFIKSRIKSLYRVMDLDDLSASNAREIVKTICHALWNGHCKLAGHMISWASGNTFTRFLNLHHDVLLGTGEDLKYKINSNSVTSQAKDTSGCTPMHCAAINPNCKYLTALLNASPDMNCLDLKAKKPTHYAAVCVDPGPLKLLMKWGANVLDVDNNGYSPLHMACETGRAWNVKELLKPKSDAGGQDELIAEKYGSRGIKRPTRSGYQPIHLAAEKGYEDVLEVLLQNGADINAQLSISKFRLTPLMLAASTARFDVVKYLVNKGAVVRQKDRLGRTALIHTVMNGHTRICSYLLNIGEDPNTADSSGNSAIHYASAYGWSYVLSLLLEAGADPSTQNLWKLSPISIAWLKGHRGMVSLLLEDDRVDVNFKDDKGQTLVHTAASSPIVEDLYQQISYLIDEKGGDPSILDSEGESALFALINSPNSNNEDIVNERKLKIVKLLVKHGCPVDNVSKSGKTALTLAVENVSLPICSFLMERGAKITTSADENGDTLLHKMAKSLVKDDMTTLLRLLLKQKPERGASGSDFKALLKEMANKENYDGYTPLLMACQMYQHIDVDRRSRNLTQIREVWKQKREFLRLLIVELGADASATVGKRFFQDDPENKMERTEYDHYGKCSCVDFLVRKNWIEGENGGTEGQFPALDLILKHKPNLNYHNRQGDTPLMYAVERGDIPLVEALIKHGADVNLPRNEQEDNQPKNYPLNLAIHNGFVAVAELLIKKGANVEKKLPSTQRAPIHDAATYRDEETRLKLLKVLVSAKCNLNIKDVNGRTALHLAVSDNQGTINSSNLTEDFLLKSGADVFAKDTEQRMPIQYVFYKINRTTDKSHLDPIELCRLMGLAMKFKQLDSKDVDGQTVLHRAATRGAYLSCTYILQKAPYMSVSEGDLTGTTALGYAVYNSHDSCACMLIQHEDKAVAKDIVIMDTTELENLKKDEKASHNSSDDSEENSDDDDDDDDMDSDDVDSDDSDYVPPLKKRKSESNDKSKVEKPLWIWKPLRKPERVVEAKRMHIFERAIDKELQGVSFLSLELPVDVSNLGYAKAVSIAIGQGKFHVAKRLIEKVPDKKALCSMNKDEQNLLHQLALKWSGMDDLVDKVVDSLLEHKVNLLEKDKFGREPVFYAIYNHNFLLATKYLSKMKKIDANAKDIFGRNMVISVFWKHRAVAERIGNLKTLFAALKKVDFDVLSDLPIPDECMETLNLSTLPSDFFTAPTQYKCTPLIQAILFESFDLAKYLVNNKASVNLPDTNSLTPLIHAVKKNTVKMVKLLLNHNYDPVKETEQIEAEKRKNEVKKKQTQNKFTLKRIPTDESGSDSEEDEEEEIRKPVEEEEKIPGRKEFRAVPYKSKVNLNGQDCNGWTALHYCAQNLPLGTYDNAEIAWLLLEAGVNFSLENNDGQTPLDLALEVGAEKVAFVIQEKMKIKEEKWKLPDLLEERDGVDDGLKWSYPSPDVEADSKSYLDIVAANIPNKDKDVHKEEVDSRCTLKDTGELVMDTDLKRPYSALLTVVDVNHGSWGLYNFYKLQLVYQESKEIYMLFTCWGRIGDHGQFQHTPFSTKEEAVKEFCKIYRAKSGNLWQDRNGTFEPKYRKYRLVTFEEEHPGLKQKEVPVNLVSKVPSKLPLYLQEVMKEFMDVSNLEAAINRAVDPDLMPFGRLRREDLLKARAILIEIGGLLQDQKKTDLNEEDKQMLWESYSKISRLSSTFYQMIPQKGFEFEKIRPLSDMSEIDKHLRMIDNLLDFEMSTKIVMGACFRKNEINPMDYVYRALNCQMRLLNQDDNMTQHLLHYISNTARDHCVEAIYSLNRLDEEPCDLGNNKLLFHGSGVANFIGILKQGLLVAPPGVPQAGALFGRGVYTADTFWKSKDYCYNYNRKSRTRYMLICKVALGKTETPENIYSFDRNILHEGYDSLVVTSETNSKTDIKLPSGITIPMGASKSSRNNEFIAFSPKQVGLRYLIQFRN